MKAKRTVPAGRFRAHCLALLDLVAETREPLVVTKWGRPVAEVVPLLSARKGSLRGSVVFRGDVVGPLLGHWGVDR